VTGLSANITAVAAVENFTCALDAAGAVRCWGDSTDYQLGGGVKSYFLTPQPVAGLSAGVAAITANGRHACALLAGGGVKCWGKNDQHQIGNDSDADTVETPADVVGLTSGVTAIDAGVSGTCAVLAGGTMRCWGTNNAKQIGDNYDSYSPRAVVGFAQ
jgi:alpha-tubulin suppressor-like RCC1 family protein